MPSSSEQSNSSFSFEAIGTLWTIEILEVISSAKISHVKKMVRERIDIFDKNYSRFRPDSLVSKISKDAGTYQLPEDAQPLMDMYKKLYEVTDGFVTPLIGNVISDAGYDSEYSFKTKQLHKAPSWEEALIYEYPKLIAKQPILLDFGAAGKGYLVDIISKLLIDSGVNNFCVNAGGDMFYKTNEGVPINVALENPDDVLEAIGVATIYNESLCGSSGNRRKWGPYNHIMDPHNLNSPTRVKAAWVTADTALLSDSLTTALSFSSPSLLQEHFEFEYAVLHKDGSLEASKNFPAEFFIMKNDV